ncbi:MAG: hypothetical protein R2806_01665 [Saprospiraceae bacterium]
MKPLLKLSIAAMLFLLAFVHGWSQDYRPDTGNTHYPNGTIYLTNGGVPGSWAYGQGPVVLGPPRKDGSQETVPCDDDPQRCRELLEAAADDAAGSTTTPAPGPVSGGAEGGPGEVDTGESTSEMLRTEVQQYIAHLKIKPGVWLAARGKWTYCKDPKSWNKKIYNSWK